jgi:hypothetical protein
VFYEFKKIQDNMPAHDIISLLRQGIVEQHDAARAARLLFYQIERCKHNNGLPDYGCEAGIATVLYNIKKKGIFEYCHHKTKTMPLVHIILNYLDLSVTFRGHLIKRLFRSNVQSKNYTRI